MIFWKSCPDITFENDKKNNNNRKFKAYRKMTSTNKIMLWMTVLEDDNTFLSNASYLYGIHMTWSMAFGPV